MLLLAVNLILDPLTHKINLMYIFQFRVMNEQNLMASEKSLKFRKHPDLEAQARPPSPYSCGVKKSITVKIPAGDAANKAETIASLGNRARTVSFPLLGIG